MSGHTKGPWATCHNGQCSCGQIWGDDAPVATVTFGAWGDTYPALRLTDEPSMTRRAEAYLERIDYGTVDKETAESNARLIAAAPSLLEALERLTDSADIYEQLSPADIRERAAALRHAREVMEKATNDEAYAPKPQDGVKALGISEPGQAVEVESADGEGQEANQPDRPQGSGVD